MPRKIDVVVFDHDHIIQTNAMVVSATQPNGPFFELSQSGTGLPGIQYTGFGMAHQL